MKNWILLCSMLSISAVHADETYKCENIVTGATINANTPDIVTTDSATNISPIVYEKDLYTTAQAGAIVLNVVTSKAMVYNIGRQTYATTIAHFNKDSITSTYLDKDDKGNYTLMLFTYDKSKNILFFSQHRNTDTPVVGKVAGTFVAKCKKQVN